MPVVEVIAHLGAPVVVTDALHLDGILSAVHPDCVGGGLTRTCAEDEIARPPIPLVARSAYGEEVYLCSAEEWPEGARRRSGHLTRRRDGDDLDRLTKPVQTASGPARDVLLRFPVVEAPWVRWIAVGGPEGIERLIRRARSVGSQRRQGYGEVLRWEVREMAEAKPMEAIVSSGAARRHLPAAWCEAPEIVDVGAVRPPYWHPSSRGPRVRRGTPTGIRGDIELIVSSSR